MTLKIGDRVAFAGPSVGKYFFGAEGTVVGPYAGSFAYAAKIKWDQPGPPDAGCIIEGYLVLLSVEPDETEAFFV